MKNKRKRIAWIMCLLLCMYPVGCAGSQNEKSEAVSTDTGALGEGQETGAEKSSTINLELHGDYSDKAIAAEWSMEDATLIQLDGKNADIRGEGAELKDGVISITQKGAYVLSGSSTDLQILVDSDKEENVQLVLNGVQMSHTTQAPIVVLQAKNCFLTLADGSENVIVDLRAQDDTDEEDSDAYTAAVFSKQDLIINGSGSLTIEAQYKDGITSKDDLEIVDGTIRITAADDGIVGKDSISMRTGVVEIIAADDGMKSSNADDTEKGYIVIDGGTITISAGDDGIHSENALVVNDGVITITDSYEGMESMNIVINGGEIDITASDDGINISAADTTAGDAEAMSEMPEMGEPGEREMRGGRGKGDFGMAPFEEACDGIFILNGGVVHVNASGDALDSNGDVEINDGIIVLSGSVDGSNGAVDYAGSCILNGGSLLQLGNRAMAQTVPVGENAALLSLSFQENQAAGVKVSICTEDGEVLFKASADKAFNFLSFSSELLQADETYLIFVGESSNMATAGQETSEFNGGFGGRMDFGERDDLLEGGRDFGERDDLPEGGRDFGERDDLPEGGPDFGERDDLPGNGPDFGKEGVYGTEQF